MKRTVSLENTILISPLVAHHYFIDLPPIKKKHEYEAVRFALRPLYPGIAEKTSIDYTTLIASKRITHNLNKNSTYNVSKTHKNKFTCIAINSKTLKTYTAQNLPIISPTILLQQLKNTQTISKPSLQIQNSIHSKNSFSILVTDKWTQVLYFEKNIPVSKITYDKTQEPYSCIDICNFIQKNKKKNDLICIYTYKKNLHSKNVQQIEDVVTSQIIKKSQIFSTQKPNKKKLHKAIVLIILTIFLCGFTDLFLYINLQNRLKTSQQLEKQYNTIITQQEKTHLQDDKEEILVAHEESTPFISTYKIVEELYKVKKDSWINSLILKENSFQFEAEGAQALSILEALEESDFFTDVCLHQVRPSDYSKEVFSITGKIKND